MARAYDMATGSATLPAAVDQRQGGGVAPWSTQRAAPPPAPRQFRWFTPALGLLLGGYLFFNKSFAYIHVPGTPVFVGEIVMAIGIAEVLRVRSPWYHLLQSSPILRALLAFMALCAARLAVDLPVYHIDAVRDSSIWYYGIFAFLAAAAAVREPTFVPRLLRWYRRVLPWYLLWVPVMVALTQVEALSAIHVPGTTTPVNTFRPNDIAVHVGVGLGFLWLGVDRMVGVRPARSRDGLISVVGLIALLVAGSQNRGGFVAALATLAIVLAFLPSGRRRRIVLSGTAGLLAVLGLALMLNLRIQGERRDISVQQVAANVSSLTGDESNRDLSGTVEWREGFWHEVLNDLLSSRAWLTGLGFGQILPERYEVDVGDTNSEGSTTPLRSVHNSHLTILARVGFPGFGLWLLLWLTYIVHLLRWIRRLPAGVDNPATATVAWFLAAVPAFLTGAYFDPSLEGPHAAVWLFTVVGLGAAVTRVRRPVTAPVRTGAAMLSPRLAPVPTLLPYVRRVAEQLRRGAAEQAASGLATFAVAIYTARSLGVQELGALSMALATYLIVLAAARGLVADALIPQNNSEDPASYRRAAARAAGTAVVLGLVAGAGSIVASLPLSGSTGAALLGLGITLPGLLLRDSCRSALLASRRRPQAIANDLLWSLALIPAMAIVGLITHASVGWIVLAWGAAATFAAAVGAVQARLVPRVPEAVGGLRRHRDLARRSLGACLSLTGASQLQLYWLTAVAGLAAAGSLTAAELLLAPPTALVAGAVLAEPEAAGMLRRSSTRSLLLFSLLLSAVGAGGALLWGIALSGTPDSLGVQILHSAWLPASRLLLPATLALAGCGLLAGAWVGVRALGVASRSLRARRIGSIVYLAAALAGATLGGAPGAAWGSAVGALTGAGVWWWELRQGLRAAAAARDG